MNVMHVMSNYFPITQDPEKALGGREDKVFFYDSLVSPSHLGPVCATRPTDQTKKPVFDPTPPHPPVEYPPLLGR